jgi:hypothetical protein
MGSNEGRDVAIQSVESGRSKEESITGRDDDDKGVVEL